MRSRLFFLWLGLLCLLRPAYAQTELIVNGGFEDTSAAPWQLSNAQIGTGANAYAGTQCLSLGGAAIQSQSAYQTITFPTNLIAATFSFYYEVISSDSTGVDTMNISITDTNNHRLANLETFSSTLPTGGYVLFTTNLVTYKGPGALSAYAGATARVLFTAQSSSGGAATLFNIDNVSMLAATTANVPANDEFTNAAIILGNTATNLLNIAFATLEAGEPELAGNSGGHSVWWTWTSTGPGTVYMNTVGSAFTTLLGAYTGSTLTNLTPMIASNGNTNATGWAGFHFNVLKAGTVFQIALEGSRNQSGQAEFNFAFVPDTTSPVVTITSPKVGVDLTNSDVVVEGTAEDNIGVASVHFYEVNSSGDSGIAGDTSLTNGASTNAYSFGSDTASWQVRIPLSIGPNTITIQAFDTSGNSSASVSRVLNYIVATPLGLSVTGHGTVSISGAATIASPTNGQLLHIGYPYVLTAHPAPGFAFSNWTGSIESSKPALKFTMSTDLGFTANFVQVQRPVLNITAPKPNEHWSNGSFIVTGKASDLVALSNVWFQFNGSAWTTNVVSTNHLTNWSVSVALGSGAHTASTNTFRACVQDAAGLFSPTNSVTFLYVESDRPQVETTGEGTVSPNDNNVLLQLGRTLTMTAEPGKNSVFSNWTDGAGQVLTNRPKLTFLMASNLELIAHFVPNPYYIAAGSYEGLFYNSNAMAQNSSGYFSAQVSSNGAFTAKFQQGTVSRSLSGQFSVTGGWATNAVKTWGNAAVSLQLDLTDGKVLAGGLTNADWSAQLLANRDVWTKSNPAPQATNYTLVLPGTNSGNLPAGNGYGSVTVSPLGVLTFNGKLGDGTKAIQTTFVSEQGMWPFFVTDGAAGGMALGWLTFASESDRDIDGWVSWFKPAQSTATLFKEGFTNTLEAAGSAYSLPSDGLILNLTNGTVTLSGGDLPRTITDSFILGLKNQVSDSNKLTLTFTPATGLFQGSATNNSGKPISFSGAVLQKQNAGFGLFLGPAQTGSVTAQSAP